MSKDYYLDGNYTAKQIEAINNVKGKKADASAKATDGDSASIFDDIKSYKKDKTSNKNKDLFDYIEKNIGMDNFLDMLDADGNGDISKDEAEKISNYDNDNKLSSKDVDALVKDIKDVKEAKTTSEAGYKKTEDKYETDTDGKLVKKSSTVTNSKKNITTEYEYKDGKKASSKVYANNDGKTLKAEYTYNDKGKPETKKAYIDSRSGVRTQKFRTYEYDDNGNLKTSKIYKGDSATGNPIEERQYENGKIKSSKTFNEKGEVKAEYDYTYDNGKLTTKENKTNGNKRTFKYDDNGKLISSEVTNKDGKVLRTYEYNEDRTVKSKKTDKYVTIYEYTDGGIRKSATKYKKEDIGDDGKPKTNAKAISTQSYSNGLKEQTKAKDGSITKYKYDNNYNLLSATTNKDGKETEKITYENGKIKTKEDLTKNTKTEYTYDTNGNKTQEVVTNTKTNKKETINYDPKTGRISYKSDGTYVYVYSYDNDGKQTVKKYKASDCTDGKPKDGAKEVK